MANLTGPLLKDMQNDLKRIVRKDGILMLSGIYAKEYDDLNIFADDKFVIIKNEILDGWAFIALNRNF